MLRGISSGRIFAFFEYRYADGNNVSALYIVATLCRVAINEDGPFFNQFLDKGPRIIVKTGGEIAVKPPIIKNFLYRTLLL